MASKAQRGKARVAVQGEEGMVVREIPLEHILPDPHQPRTQFNKGALEELANSIDTQGLQQLPVVNRAYVKDGIQYYYLKAGERRYHAHILLKKKTIMCVVEKESYNGVYDPQRELAQAAENSSREPHTHNEIVGLVERIVTAEINARGQVHGSVNIALQRVARAFGKSEAWVQNYHTLTKLTKALRPLLDEADDEKRLNFNIACALARAPEDQQLVLYSLAKPLKSRGGHGAMLQFITREGRSIREGRGERVRGRASDDRTALERLVRTLSRQAIVFLGDRKKDAHREYVNHLLSTMRTIEVDLLLLEIKQALMVFEDLKAALDARRDELYRPFQVVTRKKA